MPIPMAMTRVINAAPVVPIKASAAVIRPVISVIGIGIRVRIIAWIPITIKPREADPNTDRNTGLGPWRRSECESCRYQGD